MGRALTVDEVANALRIAPYTVRSWLRKGKIRGRKIGRSYLIPESEIRALVGEPAPAPPAGERVSAMGLLAHIRLSREQYERMRQEEIEIEERRHEEHFSR